MTLPQLEKELLIIHKGIESTAYILQNEKHISEVGEDWLNYQKSIVSSLWEYLLRTAKNIRTLISSIDELENPIVPKMTVDLLAIKFALIILEKRIDKTDISAIDLRTQAYTMAEIFLRKVLPNSETT